MTVVGYTRPTAADRSTSADVARLKELGAARVIRASADDSKLASLRGLDPGTTLVVTSLKRLANRLPDLVRISAELRDRGISIRCEDAPAFSDPSPAVSRLLRELSDFQRAHVGAQIRTSLAETPARTGRPSTLTEADLEVAREMRARRATYREISEVLGVGAQAVGRALTRAEKGTQRPS